MTFKQRCGFIKVTGKFEKQQPRGFSYVKKANDDHRLYPDDGWELYLVSSAGGMKGKGYYFKQRYLMAAGKKERIFTVDRKTFDISIYEEMKLTLADIYQEREDLPSAKKQELTPFDGGYEEKIEKDETYVQQEFILGEQNDNL